MSSLTEKVFSILQEAEKEKFTSKQLAEIVAKKYKNEFFKKRSKFESDKEFVNQLQAEIGAQKSYIGKKKNVIIDEQKRPKLYYYDTTYNAEDDNSISNVSKEISNISEDELYPLLASYLKNELNIYSKRIDEKKSKNNKGQNGNKWLHPDTVGVQFLDRAWEDTISECMKSAGDNQVKLYSFEVKIIVTPSKLREYFFQAVSNSSWANYGFLVAVEYKGKNTFEELKMLSELHGIGVIILDIDDPTESKIQYPSREKNIVDWASINRLNVENNDFDDFIRALKIYYKTGEINKNTYFKA